MYPRKKTGFVVFGHVCTCLRQFMHVMSCNIRLTIKGLEARALGRSWILHFASCRPPLPLLPEGPNHRTEVTEDGAGHALSRVVGRGRVRRPAQHYPRGVGAPRGRRGRGDRGRAAVIWHGQGRGDRHEREGTQRRVALLRAAIPWLAAPRSRLVNCKQFTPLRGAF